MTNARHRPGPALVILALLGAIAAVWPAPAAQPAQPFAFNLPAPKLAGKAEDWLNTEGKKLEFEKGRVYVVEFWTFGCINCQRNLPAYARWQKRFADQKLTIIGVHTPETAEEKKTENVIAHVKQLGITYPVLLDQAAVNWKKWQQQWWPTVYLVDKKGQVRYRWLGELNWQKATGDEDMAKCIEKLLAEGGTGTNASVVVR